MLHVANVRNVKSCKFSIPIKILYNYRMFYNFNQDNYRKSCASVMCVCALVDPEWVNQPSINNISDIWDLLSILLFLGRNEKKCEVDGQVITTFLSFGILYTFENQFFFYIFWRKDCVLSDDTVQTGTFNTQQFLLSELYWTETC